MASFALYGLLLTAFVAGVFGETCTPEQWEGYGGSTGGYDLHGRPGIIKEYKEISYDAKNQRKAIFLKYENDDYKGTFKMVIRHDKNGGKFYLVNLDKKTCWIKTYSEDFRKMCLTADAKHKYDYSMGLEKGGLKVSSYTMKTKALDVLLTVSKAGDAIIPVGEQITGYFMGSHFLMSATYFDITPGIKNASVFDVPEVCKEETDMTEFTQQYLMREHSVFGL